MYCVKSLLVASVISTGVIAKVECKPFVEEKKIIKLQVEDFSYGVDKIISKISKLEEKLDKKQMTIDSLSSDVEVYKSQMQAISLEIFQIRQQSNGAQDELISTESKIDSLSMRISQIEYTLQSNISSGRRRNLNREKMRSIRKMSQLESKKFELEATIASVNQQIEPLRDQRMQIKTLRDIAEGQLSMELTVQPTMALLETKIAKEQVLLADSESIQESLIAELEQAKEKVLMCKTYKVKYPLVMSIASEVASVGCQDYELRDFQVQVKIDAQDEILASLCPVD